MQCNVLGIVDSILFFLPSVFFFLSFSVLVLVRNLSQDVLCIFDVNKGVSEEGITAIFRRFLYIYFFIKPGHTWNYVLRWRVFIYTLYLLVNILWVWLNCSNFVIWVPIIGFIWFIYYFLFGICIFLPTALKLRLGFWSSGTDTPLNGHFLSCECFHCSSTVLMWTYVAVTFLFRSVFI